MFQINNTKVPPRVLPSNRIHLHRRDTFFTPATLNGTVFKILGLKSPRLTASMMLKLKDERLGCLWARAPLVGSVELLRCLCSSNEGVPFYGRNSRGFLGTPKWTVLDQNGNVTTTSMSPATGSVYLFGTSAWIWATLMFPGLSCRKIISSPNIKCFKWSVPKHQDASEAIPTHSPLRFKYVIKRVKVHGGKFWGRADKLKAKWCL